MKIYVIPIENACNAKCPFCITPLKKETEFGKVLSLDKLKILKEYCNNDAYGTLVDKIEITGGGEPFLHSNIIDIINYCCDLKPTQIYTNGQIISSILKEGPYYAHRDLFDALNKLKYLCVSRCHYHDDENKEIMGVKTDMTFITHVLDVPIKLSLVLQKGVIDSWENFMGYAKWAGSLGTVKHITIRQMFDYNYPEEVKDKFVPVSKLYDEYLGTDITRDHYGIDPKLILPIRNEQGNPIITIFGIKIEFEQRTCACEIFHPVLRGNGKMYIGWTNKPFEIDGEPE